MTTSVRQSALRATSAVFGTALIGAAVLKLVSPGPLQVKGRLRTTAGDSNYAVTAVVAADPRPPGTPPGPDAKETRP